MEFFGRQDEIRPSRAWVPGGIAFEYKGAKVYETYSAYDALRRTEALVHALAL